MGYGNDNPVVIPLFPGVTSLSSQESAVLGAELIDSTGWTSTDWTGNYATGFVHTTGKTTALSRTMISTGTKIYQVSFKVNSATSSSAFTVQLGNSVAYVMYRGAGTEFTYTAGIKSVSDGNLVFTPESAFDGTISEISVKEITASFAPVSTMKDSTGANALEFRPTLASLYNTYIGVGAGKYNTTGKMNFGLGASALEKNTSGYWNTAIGYQALALNTVGSRNIAIGKQALVANISGHRNVAVGTFALSQNTHGTNNIGLGADALFVNTTGNYNISIGLATLSSNSTGNNNIAIGMAALATNTTGENNIAIGFNALVAAVSVNNNIAIGVSALQSSTTTPNLAIGYNSQISNTTGNNNTAIGNQSLCRNTTGVRNTAIGVSAGYGGGSTGAINRNTLIGYNAGSALTTGGDENIMIGASCGYTSTTGANNILIGYNVQAPEPTTSNYLNIGGAITGNLTTKDITLIAGLIAASLPTTEPATVGAVWNDAGTLKVKLPA